VCGFQGYEQNTYEVRLFNSTIKHNELIAALELVDFLARLAVGKTLRQIYRMTWQDIASEIPSTSFDLASYLDIMWDRSVKFREITYEGRI